MGMIDDGREPVTVQVQCDECNGLGVSDAIWHQDENGNAEQELIRCNKCDGQGWYLGYE